MEIYSIQAAALLLALSASTSVLENVGFENLWAGIVTFVVGIWMLSFGLLLRFNKTPGPHPMRVNGYILLALSIFSAIANVIVIALSLGSGATAGLISYGIPSVISLVANILVISLAYGYVVRHKNFKHSVGTYIILLGVILILSSLINFYYYYSYLQLQYFLVIHPGAV